MADIQNVIHQRQLELQKDIEFLKDQGGTKVADYRW